MCNTLVSIFKFVFALFMEYCTVSTALELCYGITLPLDGFLCSQPPLHLPILPIGHWSHSALVAFQVNGVPHLSHIWRSWMDTYGIWLRNLYKQTATFNMWKLGSSEKYFDFSSFEQFGAVCTLFRRARYP